MSIDYGFMVCHPPIIIEDIGKGEEKKIQKTIDAYLEVAEKIAEIKPDTIIISSPHAPSYLDFINLSAAKFARGSFENFGCKKPIYEFEYDTELTRAIDKSARRQGLSLGCVDEVCTLDHGTLVPLHFILKKYHDFKIISLGISSLNPAEHYNAGMVIEQEVERLNRRAVWVASGDLSHKLSDISPYGYNNQGEIFDSKCIESLSKADFLSLMTMDSSLTAEAAQCGLNSFIEMSGAFDRRDVKSDFLAYEKPFGIGYATCIINATSYNPSRNFLDQFNEHHQSKMKSIRGTENDYVAFARQSLETYIREGRRISVEETDLQIDNIEAPCFVSIHKFGNLRGCIGTYIATKETLAEEICANAISAGCFDPRFSAVEEDELKDLVYSVDILGAAETIENLNELNPSKYGLIISTSDNRCGLLLPDLDGVDTCEEQVKIAARKAHINLFENDIKLQRFEVERHK